MLRKIIKKVAINVLKYDSNYENQPVGGGNPYYECIHCHQTDPSINGYIFGHSNNCLYVEKRLREILTPVEYSKYSSSVVTFFSNIDYEEREALKKKSKSEIISKMLVLSKATIDKCSKALEESNYDIIYALGMLEARKTGSINLKGDARLKRDRDFATNWKENNKELIKTFEV